jgi:hypothetical protein
LLPISATYGTGKLTSKNRGIVELRKKPPREHRRTRTGNCVSNDMWSSRLPAAQSVKARKQAAAASKNTTITLLSL